MKLRFEHKVIRPFAYTSAEASREPGYLLQKFRAMQKAKQQAARDAQLQAEQDQAAAQAKVRLIKKAKVG